MKFPSTASAVIEEITFENNSFHSGRVHFLGNLFYIICFRQVVLQTSSCIRSFFLHKCW